MGAGTAVTFVCCTTESVVLEYRVRRGRYFYPHRSVVLAFGDTLAGQQGQGLTVSGLTSLTIPGVSATTTWSGYLGGVHGRQRAEQARVGAAPTVDDGVYDDSANEHRQLRSPMSDRRWPGGEGGVMHLDAGWLT